MAPRRGLPCIAFLVAVVAATAGGGGAKGAVSTVASTSARPVNPPGGALTGTVTRTDQIWTCDGPVNLTSVTVTISTPDPGGKKADAVKLATGCTGSIGRITVTQHSGDGIKVATGAHDLTISGGSVTCLDKYPDVHQDGIQVMGGSKITFRNMSIDCGRTNASLIDANFFVNMGGQATEPPSDVVCDRCTFGGNAAHTVSIQDSVRSGVTSSTVCPAKYPALTVAVGPDAVSPKTAATYGACPGQGVQAGAAVAPTLQRG